jgi:hypothetical protein
VQHKLDKIIYAVKKVTFSCLEGEQWQHKAVREVRALPWLSPWLHAEPLAVLCKLQSGGVALHIIRPINNRHAAQQRPLGVVCQAARYNSFVHPRASRIWPPWPRWLRGVWQAGRTM